MIKIKDYNLALGVINNILVCDIDNNVVFAGDQIQKILFSDGSNYSKKLLDNFSDHSIREGLKKKMAAVRERKNTQQFSFGDEEETIFLFPANYNEGSTILLSTKKQMLLANKIENDLNLRVKELECLYNISNELELTRDLPGALEKSIEHLITGFQYPDFTMIHIQVDGTSYGTKGQGESREYTKSITEDILVNDKVRGKIEVYCNKTEEFLEEELLLLREIALMVSKFIEKKEIRKDLEKQRKLLVSQNKELTQLTDRLTTSNNSLQALFNAMPDSIVLIDKDFNITISNKAEIGNKGKCYNKLFGYDRICENCPTLRVFREAEPMWYEKKMDDQFFRLRSYPILDNRGNVDRVIEICRNITKEKQMELQLIQSYKLASLGKLTAGVAHEINNPNTFIRGNINIISEAFDDILPILNKAYENNSQLKIARLNYELFKDNILILLEDMMAGANRIKKIVDELRKFARKDEGLFIDEVDINFLVNEHLRITQKEVRKYAQLKINLRDDIPKFKGNIQKLEQVLMNLLLNASQAIEHGNGLIVLETDYNETDNKVIINITDNGTGIGEKTRKHIFDPFFTTKRDKGGTGLGLSISYGIIQEHNGRIDVESKVGEGTTFTISIPVVSPTTEHV